MRVLDWFRWKLKKINNWVDFYELESEVLQKIKEFYPEPKYLVDGGCDYYMHVIDDKNDVPIAITIDFDYMDMNDNEICCSI